MNWYEWQPQNKQHRRHQREQHIAMKKSNKGEMKDGLEMKMNENELWNNQKGNTGAMSSSPPHLSLFPYVYRQTDGQALRALSSLYWRNSQKVCKSLMQNSLHLRGLRGGIERDPHQSRCLKTRNTLARFWFLRMGILSPECLTKWKTKKNTSKIMPDSTLANMTALVLWWLFSMLPPIIALRENSEGIRKNFLSPATSKTSDLTQIRLNLMNDITTSQDRKPNWAFPRPTLSFAILTNRKFDAPEYNAFCCCVHCGAILQDTGLTP